MAPPLPLGLPPGTDPDSAIWNQALAPAGVGATSVTVTIPSGSVWLMLSISCHLGTGGVAGTRFVGVELFDTESTTPWWSNTCPSGLIANTVANVSFALGVSDSTGDARAQFDVSASLPWLVGLPGWKWIYLIENPLGTDAIGDVRYTYLEYDYGSVSGGSPQPEQLGPFMFVPGPTEEVAA